MYYLKQSTDEGLVTEIKIDGLTIYTGYYGKKKVIVINTAPSKNTQGPVYAAIITTKLLDKVKSIKHIIAIGVCFGKNSKVQKLGEVIISTVICDFVCTRKGVWETYRQGVDSKVKDDVVKEFPLDLGTGMPQEFKIKVSKGPIITTPNLIDNREIKDELFKNRPDALAGDMEGAGIMAAIEYAPKRAESLDVIVIKGIGDWGDGNKKAAKGWKPIAARAAAHYVHAVLNK